MLSIATRLARNITKQQTFIRNMSTHTVKWGILATGGIAEAFGKDLSADPAARGVKGIKHEIVAAASSSSADRAQTYLKKVLAPSHAKAYGSYKELVADPNVDIIYVATPHSHHYQNARLALEAGKNVLCEKAFTTNAKQLRTLVDIAKQKNLFLMEAVWTRYFPLSIYVRDQITSGRIGHVYRVEADNSTGDSPESSFDDTHRMVNPDLAGGALLDLGIYSLTWIFQTLYTIQPAETRKAPKTAGFIRKYRTGADESTTAILSFPRSKEQGGDAHAVATTSLLTNDNIDGKHTAGPGVRIYGEKGEIQVYPPPFRPTRTRLILADGTVEDKEWPQPDAGMGKDWKNGFGGSMNGPGELHGMAWEADEAGLALQEGRKEGKYESLEESLTIMEVMDEIRRQNDLRYPDKIETTDYPVDL